MKEKQIQILKECWNELYGYQEMNLLEVFLADLENYAATIDQNLIPQQKEWYKDAIVYSLYVDLFNYDFNGLKNKLDYLSELGVSCLWLLPVLDSPMRDAGFDISNYRKIRDELLGPDSPYSQKESSRIFGEFLEEAHKKDIMVIFDIAINHISDQHSWFREARKSEDNPFRDYFIWSKDTNKYKEARLLFKGMCPSNWEKDGDSEWYYFHRFFEFQPDLNYRNPRVLLEMSSNFLFWLKLGVDGFRADAIPYLWKEEGTDCENLPQTHTIVRFFRAAIEYARPNTLLLAEACQKPKDIVRYLETEEECNAGYHFPLMPQMFKAIAQQSREPVIKTLDISTTPEIPPSSQWFTFLRCHDELSLELVYISEEDRKYIHEHYCHKPEWDFRVGEGISARLSELMQMDVRKISAAYSLMLSLPGTPVIYYGDEYGKANDMDYYREMTRMTGKDDTRFLVRGRMDWEEINKELNDPESFSYRVFQRLSKMILTRKSHAAFGRGKLEWKEVQQIGKFDGNKVIAFLRTHKCERILIVQNLSENTIPVIYPEKVLADFEKDLLGQKVIRDMADNTIVLEPYAYYWFLT